MKQFKIDNSLKKPTLLMNGEVIAPVLYGLSDFPAAASSTAQAQKNIAQFKAAGVNLVNIDTAIHLGWHKVTPFDTSPILAEIANVLDVNPDAKVLVRLHMNPPYWWLRDNPEECVIYRTPEGDVPGLDDGNHDRLIAYDAQKHMRVSLASQKWLEEAEQCLCQLCIELSQKREGNALLGIQVACGIFGEWHQWGIDVSKPMQTLFRTRLRERYKTDEGLQKAWGMNDVTIENAEFHPEPFYKGDVGIFRDPKQSRFVFDAQECVQSSVPDAILRFCKVIKRILPHTLTGAFYGYFLGTNGDDAAICGHLGIERIYQAKGTIDFLCGPFCYMENRNPDGVPMQRGLLEASRIRGMLWLTEMDQHPDTIEGDETKLCQSIAVLRRNVLQPLLAGQGLWYYDHRIIPRFDPTGDLGSIYRKRGWWDRDEYMEEIKKLQKLALRIAGREYESCADVLLVYDTASYYCRAAVEEFEYKIHAAIARTGVAYDCVYKDTLQYCDLSQYRCVIFVNVYMLSVQERKMYRDMLKGIKTVWLYAQGYCDGDILSVSNISDTVGMKLSTTQNAQYMVYDGDELLISERTAPVFCVELKDGVIPLAFYDNGEAAAAIKDDDIWIGLPLLNEKLAHYIIKLSGAHIYTTDNDPIIAGAGMVAINSSNGGKRELILRNGKRIVMDLSPFTTAVIDAKTGERIL